MGVPGSPTCTVLTDPIMIGRGVQLDELVQRARAGRHTLLIGDEGTGKTRVIEELARVVAGRRVRLDPDAQRATRRTWFTMPQQPDQAFTLVYVAEAAPQGRLVDTVARAFHRLGIFALPDVPAALRAAACAEYDWPEVKKLVKTVDERQQAVVASLDDMAEGGRAPRLIVALDALDRCGPAQGLFLRELQQRVTVIGACRSIPSSRSLRTFFATFGQLRVERLPDHAISALFEHFVSSYDITPSDRRHYRREVLRRADGNPAILRAMMHDGAQSRLVTHQDVRDLQARDDAPFFNLGLIYVFFLIGLGTVRVMAGGGANADLYIILSIVTIIGFLVFRVFRVLFMFQPRPPTANDPRARPSARLALGLLAVVQHARRVRAGRALRGRARRRRRHRKAHRLGRYGGNGSGSGHRHARKPPQLQATPRRRPRPA
jgi:hypothetical protein